MNILDGLNDEQRAVVEHCEGPLLVSATAGSGKTTALARRVAQLVASGVSPKRILAVTFSAKAAREMNERLAKLGCEQVVIRTFHSLALTIVRAELEEMASWRIDDSDRYRICVKDAVSFRYIDWKQSDVTHLQSYIARCKASGAAVKTAKALDIATQIFKRRAHVSREPNLCARAYEVAEQIRYERQLLTFDDVLFEAWALFERDEDARQRWASRFDYVLQDEVQDENTVQHQLGEFLARDHKNYMVVGDVCQAIYGFRGADPSMMLTFEQEWGARVIAMNRNYRCASRIVDVANRSLEAMPKTLGVRMVAHREVEGDVRSVEYQDFDDEGEGVTERILESHESGREWREHVVLYRTNAQSRGIEEALLSARVPYVVLGGTNFYDRREVKDLLAYLRIGSGKGVFDDVRRSINTPFRYLGKAFIEGLENDPDVAADGARMVDDVRQYVLKHARLQKRQHASALSWCVIVSNLTEIIQAGRDNRSTTRDQLEELAARPGVLLEGLVADLKYCDWLTRDEGAESPENNRVSNVRELIRAAGRFPTVDDLLKYIDETRAKAEKAKRELQGGDVVTLCSIHRSKGLEWPAVYLLGCNEKILPHGHAEDFDEERRLFYVACTRAADELQVSYVRQAAVSNQVRFLEPSRFMQEAGLLGQAAVLELVPKAEAV